MKHFETTWKTQDGMTLFAQGWEPEGAPRAAVCLIHGLGEHTGRYAHVGEALANAGYALVSFDLRGHGRSPGVRGHVDSFEQFMQDTDLLLQKARERYPGKPIFLYGHSLGSMLVLDYVMHRKPQLAGVVVSATILRNALEEQKLKVGIARTLSAILPKMTLASGLDVNHLSHDKEVLSAYQNDPLVHDRMSLRTAVVLLEALRWTNAHAREFPDLPLLMMHGTEDPIAYPVSAQEFADQVQGNVTLKYWAGMLHEIHNEPEKAKVLAYLVDWLDKRTTESANSL